MDMSKLKLPDLSHHELTALRSYKSAEDCPSGESKCFELNRELRNGIFVKELSPALREIADGLDTALSRCPLLEDSITAYRGTGFSKSLPLHETGKRFRSLEFWSTASSEAPLEQFLKLGTHSAILELRLPKGFPAYNLETLEGTGGFEQELLLPRGVLWRVQQAGLEPVGTFLKCCGVESLCRAILIAEDWPKSS